MQTFAVIWMAGWAVSTLAYLIFIWPEFREHVRFTGVALQMLHYGIRVMMLAVLWPVAVVAIVCVWWASRASSDGGDTSPGPDSPHP